MELNRKYNNGQNCGKNPKQINMKRGECNIYYSLGNIWCLIQQIVDSMNASSSWLKGMKFIEIVFLEKEGKIVTLKQSFLYS